MSEFIVVVILMIYCYFFFLIILIPSLTFIFPFYFPQCIHNSVVAVGTLVLRPNDPASFATLRRKKAEARSGLGGDLFSPSSPSCFSLEGGELEEDEEDFDLDKAREVIKKLRRQLYQVIF